MSCYFHQQCVLASILSCWSTCCRFGLLVTAVSWCSSASCERNAWLALLDFTCTVCREGSFTEEDAIAVGVAAGKELKEQAGDDFFDWARQNVY